MKKNINIIIAEDEQIIAMDIKSSLKNLGYNVTGIVNSGEKLLEMLKNQKADIVLMDIMLKGKMNGIKAAQKVSEKFNVPVIYLTALTDDQMMQRAMLTQPAGYLLKPFDDKSLYSTIERALYNHQTENEAKEKAKKLEEEKLLNDALLNNIFPPQIIKEWKENGFVIPQNHENSTILFVEFKNSLTAEFTGKLIEETNQIINSFDDIISTFGLQKLKIIGNKIMASGGIPQEYPHHALSAVKASLKMQSFIEEFNMRSGGGWFLKTGINSGQVTAGFIGYNKLSYDVWGDTVNIASRMQSASKPNKINISSDTYRLVSPYFNFEYRGRLSAKGKGQIDMYFVNSEKPLPNAVLA